MSHVVIDEPLLDVAHHPQGELGGEDAGVLSLVLLEDVRLNRAPDAGNGLGPDPLVGVRREHLIPGHPEEAKPESVVTLG